MRRFLLFLLLLAGSVPAHAQTTLTLRQSIEMAQASSPAAEIARLGFAQSQWQHRSYQGRYLPTLSLSGSAPGLDRSIEEIQRDDGSIAYVPRNLTQGRATVAVSQEIPMTGGRISVISGLRRVENDFAGVRSTQWQSTPLVLSLDQPLFQFNEMKWTRRTEPVRYAVSQRSYAEALEGVAVDITERFFAVYLAEMNLDIATFNVAINDTIFTLAQGRFDIGTIAENDLLQTELQLLNAQSAQSTARIAYQRALQDFKLALGLPYDAAVTILPPTTVPVLLIQPEEAVAQARANHPAFLRLDLQRLEADRELARARRTNGFSATLSASYGLTQSANVFDNAYRDPLDQQQFSVGFQVPIFRWGQGRATIQAAVAGREETTVTTTLAQRQLEQDVFFEALQIEQLQQQARIAAKADTVAARRFEVAKNRYLIGKIDITDLFNAQREKDAARRTYIQTLNQFWRAYYTLRRLTLFDFARREPLLFD